MKTPTTALLLACSLALVACGAPSVDDAIAEIQASYEAKSYESVIADAPDLIARCGTEGASAAAIWKVEKLKVQSMAQLGQGDDVVTELTRLDETYAGKVKVTLYAQLGGFVTNSGEYTQAISVFDACSTKYPESAPLLKPQIDNLIAKAQAAGDSSALDALKALGYL